LHPLSVITSVIHYGRTLEQVTALAQRLNVGYGVRASETKRGDVVNRDALLATTAQAPTSIELYEGEPLLGSEMLAFIPEGQGAALGGQRGSHDLELHAVASGTGTADTFAVKEVEVIVVSLVGGDELLLAEAMSAPRAPLGSFAGGNFRGVLSYNLVEGHWRTHLLWSRPFGWCLPGSPVGPLFIAYILLQIFTNVYKYDKIFSVNYRPWRLTWRSSRNCVSMRDSLSVSWL
jgi:hypothetical protein